MSPGEKSHMTLGGHFGDLRRVVIVSFIATLITSIIIFTFFSEQLFNWATSHMTELNLPLVAITVTEAFFTKIKICFIAGFIIAFPITFWQVWTFVAPALYDNERKWAYLILPIGIVLFAAGVVFAYLFVFKIAAGFLLITQGEGLMVIVSVNKYLSFLLAFLIPFGLTFEIPLIIVFLTRLGLITPQFLTRNRKYVFLISFIIAAILTPPDVISQVFMALPMLLLYEVSILISWMVKTREMG